MKHRAKRRLSAQVAGFTAKWPYRMPWNEHTHRRQWVSFPTGGCPWGTGSTTPTPDFAAWMKENAPKARVRWRHIVTTDPTEAFAIKLRWG